MQTVILVEQLSLGLEEIYVDALRADGLRAYARPFNLDAWVPYHDLMLDYETEEEVQRARAIVEELRNQEPVDPEEGEGEASSS